MKLIKPRISSQLTDSTPGDPAVARTGAIWNWTGISLLLLTCGVVLACPVFPSQDGPVHLYYVDIIRDLLRHQGPYQGFFEIKSLLTPYASEYFVLLALETVFSAEMSEKLLVCGYIFAFGFAFRYLVNSVTGEAGPWSLAAIPFCMHTLVYMGFLNYCLAVTLAMFLAGFWTRWSGRMSLPRGILMSAAFLLMLLTHPVPVAVFLIYAGIYLTIEVGRSAQVYGFALAVGARVRQIAMLAALGGTAVMWLTLFVKPSPGGSTGSSDGASANNVVDFLGKVLAEAILSPLVPFIAPSYRAVMIVLVGLAGMALIAGAWVHRGKLTSGALATLATSEICFLLYALVPLSINGSFFFPQRFPIFWIVFFFAAAAAFRPSRHITNAAGAVAIVAALIVLAMQFSNTRVADRELQTVLQAPAAPPRSVGLVIGELPPHPKGFAFDPYFWGSAHYFRKSHAIMANAPWLDLPIIMLRPAHQDRWYNLSAWEASKVLAGAVRGGDTAPELNFLLRQQPAAENTADALDHLRWPAVGTPGQIFGIYLRRADSARDH